LVHDAMNEALKLKLKIYDNRDINKIANRIKMWKERDGVRCILADFLTLFKPSDDKKFFSDTQKVNYCLEIFASLAKDIGIPIILYVQMNRDIEKRTGIKEPNMADIKQSGSIEEFAFQISFLHRPEYYDINDNVDLSGESAKGLMYQMVVKHREGELERLKFKAILKHSKLEQWQENSFNPIASSGSWKPVGSSTTNSKDDSGKLFFQKGSKLPGGDFDEGIQTTEQF